MIGSDESLKGDTFGGLVVAAVRTDENTEKLLQNAGVADSKKLTPQHIHVLAKIIKEHCAHSVKSIFPEEYNKNELTPLLNKLHLQTAKDIFKDGEKHVVDLYPGCTVGDIRETKAESKYICVAAASILAREAALEQMAQLSKEFGKPVPFGSTHVQAGLEYLKLSKKDPNKFVKRHFKNVKVFFPY